MYYSWSFFFSYFFLYYCLRIIIFHFQHKLAVLSFLINSILSFFTMFAIFTITSLYMALEFFYSLFFIILEYARYFEIQIGNFANLILNFNYNLISIYYFPFVYIFVFVTVLSIFFCLSYSLNETIMFIFYCTIIVIAGCMLFFTDSLILFFIAYELLLVPSFFIIYKFAKTRRCIEAAYLMFFWTQFGALMLIFSFLYLFSIAK
jgi:formate hydrogenlyase subunit 3/multisubunit Na+/H+ antiporter MnhD subunit